MILNSPLLTLETSCDIIVGSVSHAVYKYKLLNSNGDEKAALLVLIAPEVVSFIKPIFVHAFQLIFKKQLSPNYIFLFRSIIVSLKADNSI